MTPTLPIAFLAGLLSFLSPCVLPLVPSYLAYVGSGVGGGSAREGTGARRSAVLGSSLFFVLGFSLVFVGLGASASLIGGLLSAYRRELTLAGGLLIIFFGVVMLGVRLPLLQRDARLRFFR